MRTPFASAHTFLCGVALLLWALPGALAAEGALDCKTPVTVEKLEYDLSSLAGEKTINSTREMPPSTMVDSVHFNLCADLGTREGVPKEDQVRLHILFFLPL
jgi:autophagy-related protein 27